MAGSLREPQADTVATVAVTGGTGFIGKVLIRRLLQERLGVRALVRPASLSSRFEAAGLSWIQGDMGCTDSLHRLVEGASAVIHCAGSVRGACEADFFPANVSGVEKMVKAAGASPDCSRFLLVSSLAARSPELSDYAMSKRRGEEVLRTTARELQWAILRPPAVYGPGDRELLPLLQWIRRGLVFVPGGGDARFSLIFVEDLAGAVLSWLVSGAGGGCCFEVHDGRPGGYSWEDVRKIAVDLFRRPVRRMDVPRGFLEAAAHVNATAARIIGYRPMLTPGKVRELCHDDWVCENADFSGATGWSPRFGLREGLLRTLG